MYGEFTLTSARRALRDDPSMPAPTIDLNADLGEGAGFDEALLGIVTSANVACGAHAGSEAIAAATIAAAAARGVAVGAHPGHVDREHFGRVARPITPPELEALLTDQLDLLTRASRTAAAAAPAPAHRESVPLQSAPGQSVPGQSVPGQSVPGQSARRLPAVNPSRPRYLKLHGALYHQVADDPALAAAAVAVAKRAGLAILGPPASALLEAAEAGGIAAVAEGFADRGYELVGGIPQLVARGAPGALLPPDAAVRQAVQLATARTVDGPNGEPVAVPVGSLCVHGDTPDAVEIATRVRAALETAGVRVRACWP